MKTDNIILIGMPASGKSTVGVILAKIIGYRFLDSDLLIQEQEGKKLHQIISEKGIDGFLDVEERVNAGIAAEHTVISTGGSVVYGSLAMEHFKQIGTVVYLQVGYEELMHRLHDIQQRGVVVRQGQTMQDLYRERTALYEKYADVTIREENATPEQVIAEIIGTLNI
ncbi:MAG: shikimate kinase [Butyrivibrio sp.]|jgi:shikimate kinase|nr:shikimate kinase [Butyrivibrio sp.]